jgi:RNA polymerase sigma factor for flagellar operon FliA
VALRIKYVISGDAVTSTRSCLFGRQAAILRCFPEDTSGQGEYAMGIKGQGAWPVRATRAWPVRAVLARLLPLPQDSLKLPHADPEVRRVQSYLGNDLRSPADVDALVREHLILVGHAVRGAMARVPGHVRRDDLASAGMLALVVAAQRYDASQGVPFPAYAATRIRGAIIDELRGMDWASRSVRRRAREVEEVRGRLAGELGRPVADAEISQALGITTDELSSHQADLSRAVVASLSAIQAAARDDLLPSVGHTAHDVVEQRERLAYLQDAVTLLPERLRVVIEGYFLNDRPMTEIAEELGVTQSRVSQMRAEALALLRDALNSSLEPDLVPRHPNPTGAAARRRDAYFAEVASHRSYTARLRTDHHAAKIV